MKIELQLSQLDRFCSIFIRGGESRFMIYCVDLWLLRGDNSLRGVQARCLAGRNLLDMRLLRTDAKASCKVIRLDFSKRWHNFLADLNRIWAARVEAAPFGWVNRRWN